LSWTICLSFFWEISPYFSTYCRRRSANLFGNGSQGLFCPKSELNFLALLYG
jgi:hypothetical protein